MEKIIKKNQTNYRAENTVYEMKKIQYRASIADLITQKKSICEVKKGHLKLSSQTRGKKMKKGEVCLCDLWGKIKVNNL